MTQPILSILRLRFVFYGHDCLYLLVFVLSSIVPVFYTDGCAIDGL